MYHNKYHNNVISFRTDKRYDNNPICSSHNISDLLKQVDNVQLDSSSAGKETDQLNIFYLLDSCLYSSYQYP